MEEDDDEEEREEREEDDEEEEEQVVVEIVEEEKSGDDKVGKEADKEERVGREGRLFDKDLTGHRPELGGNEVSDPET